MPQEIIDKFHDYLKTHGLRITSERDEILRVIFETECHFTATDIHSELQKKGGNIGLATVYRTLPLLVKAGIVREADRRRCKEEQTYEHIIGHPHHDHLLCEVCGKVVEFHEPEIERMQEEVARKHGFRLRRHFLDLRGVCAQCQKEIMDKAVEEY